MASKRTFAQAQAEIFDYLQSRHWTVQLRSTRAPWNPLKVPYATSPSGDLRLWFKPQAVWYTTTGPYNVGGHIFANALSTWISDIRGMDGPQFVSEIDRMFQGRYSSSPSRSRRATKKPRVARCPDIPKGSCHCPSRKR